MKPAAVVVAVVAALGSGAVCFPQAAGSSGVEAEVKALSDDIALLEQINGIGLSPQQLRALADIAQRRAAIHQALVGKRRELLVALAQVLRQKRQLLLADQPVPDAIDEKIARLNTELSALAQAERRQAEPLVAEVRRLLSPIQLAALTGRQEARESAMEMLKWLRRLNDAQYEDEAEAAAEELAAPERGLPASDIRKIFDEARKLSEKDFLDRADELAERLLPAYAVSEAAETQLIYDLISHPRLPALLRDKLAAASG